MLRDIRKFWHHLIDPHCADCKLEAFDKQVCLSCETLKEQLAAERTNSRNLLNAIISLSDPKQEVVTASTTNFEPIRSSFTPMRVRREMMETADKEKAKIIAEQKKNEEEAKKYAKVSTEQLEKEVGIFEEIKEDAVG